jgi:hypothetical protein
LGWIFVDEKMPSEEEGSEYGAEFLNHGDNAKRGHIPLIWELNAPKLGKILGSRLVMISGQDRRKKSPKDKTRKSNLEAPQENALLGVKEDAVENIK